MFKGQGQRKYTKCEERRARAARPRVAWLEEIDNVKRTGILYHFEMADTGMDDDDDDDKGSEAARLMRARFRRQLNSGGI